MARTSNKQAEIFAFISAYIDKNNHPPSIREIADGVGLKSISTVHYHLGALREQGRIEMDTNKKRTITLPEPTADLSRINQIPVLGVVTAGLPILAQENIEGYLPWNGDSACFALRVRGDSMIGAAILDGDTIVVQPQSTAREGQIVVALLGDEATVKRLHTEKDGVFLMPENPAYAPIDGRGASILGVVKAVVREYH